jgi:hypothetical protein
VCGVVNLGEPQKNFFLEDVGSDPVPERAHSMIHRAKVEKGTFLRHFNFNHASQHDAQFLEIKVTFVKLNIRPKHQVENRDF